MIERAGLYLACSFISKCSLLENLAQPGVILEKKADKQKSREKK